MPQQTPLQRVFEIVGSRYQLAKQLNITPWAVNKWNINRPPRNRCLKLQELTNNQVTAEELRPDINWEYERHQLSKNQTEDA